MILSRRLLKVLCAIVELYIRSGGPVASGEVARVSGLGLSSATIRNIMAEHHADTITVNHCMGAIMPSMVLCVASLSEAWKTFWARASARAATCERSFSFARFTSCSTSACAATLMRSASARASGRFRIMQQSQPR